MEIKPRTALAAAYRGDERRVYLQDPTGWIHEAVYTPDSGWSNGKKIVQADLGSAIAVAYVEGLRRIRLYYLIDSVIHEFFNDGDDTWKEGSLSSFNFKVSPSTSLAARYIDGEPRVYAQVADTSIYEYKHANGKWNQSYKFGAGLYATGIGATATGEFRLFYQTTEGTIVGKIYDGDGWKDGTLEYKSATPETPIAAVSFDAITRVYQLKSDQLISDLIESVYKPADSEWINQSLSKKTIVGSKLASFGFTDGGKSKIHVYLQDEGETAISEFFYVAGAGWSTNASILPVE